MQNVSAAVALRIDDARDGLLVFHTLAVVLLAASGFGVAAHLLATSVLGARTSTLSWWVVGGGVVSAVGFLGASVLSATGSRDASSAVGFVSFALWRVWILGISTRMWTEPRRRSTALVS